MPKLTRGLCAAAVVLSCGIPASAQDSFSAKQIRIVVPFMPGSASDSLARSVEQPVTGESGQPVIVDNRPGANGFIAVQAVPSAPTNGHTLLSGGISTHSANPVCQTLL